MLSIMEFVDVRVIIEDVVIDIVSDESLVFEDFLVDFVVMNN